MEGWIVGGYFLGALFTMGIAIDADLDFESGFVLGMLWPLVVPVLLGMKFSGWIKK